MLKRSDIIIKTIWQILLYVIEVGGASAALTFLSNYLEPISSTMSLVERMMLSYSIYQILVVVILTNLNDIKKDSYLAWITILKLCLIYVNDPNEELKNTILKYINYQLDNGTFNNLEIRKGYQNLKENLDVLNETQVDTEIVIAEHNYETVTLNWRFSFILRLFK